LICYDAATGNILWHFPMFTRWRMAPSPSCWMENSIWLWVRSTRFMHLLASRLNCRTELHDEPL
jgi:hypothetical protein